MVSAGAQHCPGDRQPCGWAWALPKDQGWGESWRALGKDSGSRAPSLGRHQGLSLEAWGLSLQVLSPWVCVWRCMCSCGRASASPGGLRHTPRSPGARETRAPRNSAALLGGLPGARAPVLGPPPRGGEPDSAPLCWRVWGCGTLIGAEGTGLSVLSPGLSWAGTSPARNPSTPPCTTLFHPDNRASPFQGPARTQCLKIHGCDKTTRLVEWFLLWVPETGCPPHPPQ